MATFSRVLAVLIAATSLAFLGVVCVLLIGGPNWPAEMQALPEYTFDRTEGERVTWSVKTRSGDVVPGGSATPVAAKVVIAARDDLRRKQREELQQLGQSNPQLEDRLKAERALIQDDIVAMAGRIEQIEGQITTTRRDLATTKDETEQLAQKALATREEAKERRQDVLRVEDQLAETRADAERAEQLRRSLQDRLTRLLGTIERLERRRAQLEAQLAGDAGSAGGAASESAASSNNGT